MQQTAAYWLEKIQHLELPNRVRIMNVCGGHERTVSATGLRTALPARIELIAGPGCPVCICPEEDIYAAIQLALHEPITLVAFGDMLRVPVNLPQREIRTLLEARAAGADIRAIATPLEALQLALAEPKRTVVFFAAGFETTMAPVAAMLAQGAPDNLLLLLSGRRTWPAVSMLLESDNPGFDALIAPGHVATIMGADEWRFVPERHNIPTAIAGFRANTLVAAIYSVLRQIIGNQPFLDNCYTEVVRPGGNSYAQSCLARVLGIVDANWRGIGIIPTSGYRLQPEFQQHDVQAHFPQYADASRKRVGKMPAGCDCARVVLGRINPNQCRLYGVACLPAQPVGPCMVSDEGACRIWWSNGIRNNLRAGTRKAATHG